MFLSKYNVNDDDAIDFICCAILGELQTAQGKDREMSASMMNISPMEVYFLNSIQFDTGTCSIFLHNFFILHVMKLGQCMCVIRHHPHLGHL